MEDIKNYFYTDSINGLWGRIFGEGIYHYKCYRGNQIPEPVKVDFVGQFYFGKREYFLVDLKNTLSVYDDVMLVYLQNKTFGNIERFTIPTKNYRFSKDLAIKEQISVQAGFRKKRDSLVKAMQTEDKEFLYSVLEDKDNG